MASQPATMADDREGEARDDERLHASSIAQPTLVGSAAGQRVGQRLVSGSGASRVPHGATGEMNVPSHGRGVTVEGGRREGVTEDEQVGDAGGRPTRAGRCRAAGRSVGTAAAASLPAELGRDPQGLVLVRRGGRAATVRRPGDRERRWRPARVTLVGRQAASRPRSSLTAAVAGP